MKFSVSVFKASAGNFLARNVSSSSKTRETDSLEADLDTAEDRDEVPLAWVPLCCDCPEAAAKAEAKDGPEILFTGAG